ncbi:oxidoreductase [Acuticoccus sediminis]|uniref:Oxidoreductase n=1 Tax=Acuticoccus sediminis TaxID=2184697 RepID=A0A8B2NYL4_9HYPH|nr:Gfo/Idh/MocA family oxidoreductase [Acuticoccus sediminis]RAI00888.1 oxidoreductase [Acuticoccus sediminis]
MLKGALIGCGYFAENHLHAWRQVPDAAIVALCDTDPARLAAASQTFSIGRTYTSLEAMLAAEALDFVDIATGPRTHRALVEAVASHGGIAIICQKPIARTMADAEAMVAACAAAGVPFAIHENFRWQTPIRAVKAAMQEGAVGTPFFGRCSFRSAFDVYARQPYLATDERFIVEDLGIHILDIARFLFGEVAHLSATTKRVNPAIRAEDVATVLMGHANGVTSVVDCSYATALPHERFPQTLVEVDGSEGTLRLDADYRLTVHRRDGGTTVRDVAPRPLDWAAAPAHLIQESVLAFQRDAARCLAEGRLPETSGTDNLKTFALVQAVYRSAEGPMTRVEP